MAFPENRLFVEQIYVRWSSGHKYEDAGFGLRIKVRLPGCQRIGIGDRLGTGSHLHHAVLRQHGPERRHSDSAGSRVEELAPRSSDMVGENQILAHSGFQITESCFVRAKKWGRTIRWKRAPLFLANTQSSP